MVVKDFDIDRSQPPYDGPRPLISRRKDTFGDIVFYSILIIISVFLLWSLWPYVK